jgi:hypothetical protein
MPAVAKLNKDTVKLSATTATVIFFMVIPPDLWSRMGEPYLIGEKNV